MKPFIANALKEGKFVLGYQVENETSISLRDGIMGKSIRCLLVPSGQSLDEAWLLRLVEDNHLVLEFSAACTDVGNWREIGSLNIRFFHDAREHEADLPRFEVQEICDFRVARLERLVYEEDALRVENGIVLISENGQEIWIAAAPSPGSVTARTPMRETGFRPEIPIQDCKRVPI
jgi:hypothetical protein